MEETEGARLEMGARVGGVCLGGSRSEHMIKIDTIGRTGHFEGSPTRLGGAGGGRRHCDGQGLLFGGGEEGSKKASPAFWPVIKMSLH